MRGAMEISQESLETIGAYVRQNLPAWLEQVEPPTRRDWELKLTERIVRVEEELKSQRQLMQQGFALVDKRFEQVERRFEQIDRRFEQVDLRFAASTRQINRWMTLITILITLIGTSGAWGTVFLR